ncbi:MAG TPA: response regulator [Candidatus Acidoferrum sp.]|nr:response regulator [Candidatus Acidoferrum sp.]
MKLLLIEDHVPVADVLTEAFRDIGHEVSVAHTGEEGLRELDSNCPDAVLLDVTLPGMDGVTVLRAIRARDQHLPVIVLSGNVSPEQIEQLWSLGIHDVIHKPDTLSHLTDVLALLAGSTRSEARSGDDQVEGR